MNQVIDKSDNYKTLHLRFSSDSSTLVGARSDGTVAIWFVPSAVDKTKLVHTFASQLTLIYDLAVHPDGKLLVTAGEGPLSLWNLPSGTLYRTLHLPSEEIVQSVAFSHDGKWLITASNYEVIRVYSWKTGEVVGEDMVGERNSSIVFHPDGQTIATTCSWQGGSCIWFFKLAEKLENLEHLEIDRPYDTIIPGSFSSDGSYFAFSDLSVNLYSFPDLRLLHTFSTSGLPIFSTEPQLLAREFWSNVVFIPNSPLFACGSPQGKIFFWTVEGGGLRQILCGHEGAVWSLIINRTGSLLASCGEDGTVRLWSFNGSM